ncbi:MAG: phage holin family protein [Nitriliruptorales bacterium]
MRILLKLAIYALAVWVAVLLVDGLEFTGSGIALAVIAVILAAVNATVKPIVKLLSLPFILMTLGLFLLVLNAVMFALTIWISGLFDLGLTSTGFGATFLGAIVVSVVGWIAETVLRTRD